MSYNDDLLDQPLNTGTEEKEEEQRPVARYLITLILFPAALLRLRSGSMNAEELILGGAWSSAQFFVGGLIFTLFRFLYHRRKGTPLERKSFIAYSLQAAVELVVLVGIVQLLWQYVWPN